MSVPRDWTRPVHYTDTDESGCPLVLSVRREATTTNFKVFGRTRRGSNPRPPDPQTRRSTSWAIAAGTYIYSFKLAELLGH